MATCGSDAKAIARAIRHTTNLIGVDHVALGSDFDGTVVPPFDASGLDQITQALLDDGFAAEDIGKIMGGTYCDSCGTISRRIRSQRATAGTGHDFGAKSTFGACFASGGASKSLYSLKPNSFAVTFAGNCRRDVL